MHDVVFYSWQSDRLPSTKEDFIQQALERVAKSISIDPAIAVQPVIDRDVRGVSGAPDISRTVFDKIARATVFVADVSIINEASNNVRPAPNPNVLIELGYALHAIGEARVLLVMNTAFGGPEQLPFDLKMRHVITYEMPTKALQRSGERKRLEQKLLSAIRTIFLMQQTSPHSFALTSGSRGKRLAEVIRLMNEALGYEEFSVSVIAEAMEMEYVNELEQYINGVLEPPLSFLNRFSERLGVSAEWLKHGKSAPFAPWRHLSSPRECMDVLRELDPKRIFLVRSEAARGEVGIVVKTGPRKFGTFASDWPLSSQVGSGGASRIHDFYEFIIELRGSEFLNRVSGRLYPERDYVRLFHGGCYPGFVEKPGSVASHWWDDFGDTESPHLSREHLVRIWGTEFVRAQDIVLEQAALQRTWKART
jgi:hypothetical protein